MRIFKPPHHLILAFVLLLAAFFRLHRLSQVPPSPSLDEVSLGYNAYSLLKTGRDEYGTRLPVLLRAYDDWRPAGYVYLAVPFVKILGLNVLSVRLPAVILSLVAVLTTYFLTTKLFEERKKSFEPRLLALIASFLLAISPWHIYISRLGHEVNAGLTFSLLGILFFLKGVKDKGVFLLPSIFFWSFSFYTYQSQKIFAPLLILFLVLIYKKELLTKKKQILASLLLGLFLLIPLIRASFSGQALVRFQATSLLANQPEIYQQAASRVTRDYEGGSLLGFVFDNRRVASFLAIGRAYFSHFDPSWLFFNTGREKHKIPGLGVLYLWELPLILLGGYWLVKENFSRKTKLLLLAWLLTAPLPAAIATQAPHGMRAFNLLPVPQILAAGGVFWLAEGLRKKKQALMAAGLVIVLTLAYLYHHYFVNFPYEQSDSFQYPLKKAIEYVLVNEGKYQKVVFSNQENLYQSYMFFLFFSRYSPGEYLESGGTGSGGYAQTHTFGKFGFRPINWGQEGKEGGTLFVGNLSDFPSEVTSGASFNLLSGEKVMIAVEGGR